MKVFKVLGSGCANCINTAKLIESVAEAAGVDVKVEKITDMEAIMNYGVMSTPAVVLNEQVIHAGGVPSEEKVKSWI
ncbi:MULTISPECIES: thioredoxin family protein [Vibrio]|uniref:Thioredoxin family protein n=1 Tax=Vibrio diazotrophicus TaxID=685 RepID=A0A2J8HYW5_VIBDI|nr:thioredoxin family protein [Vibrio diazotrophicus]PNI03444.1 thioredoxin family protein [Vibrio diazotrophicus]